MMRRAAIVVSVIGLLWQTAACTSAGPPDDRPPTGSSSAPPAPPESTSAAPGTTPPAPPSPSGDVPGPLPWGSRTLTGVVERSGDCTMLLVGRRRWALTGPMAAALSPGEKVTVRGSLDTRPAGCGDLDLAQTVAVARVAPA